MTIEEEILLELQKLTAGIDAPGYIHLLGLDTGGLMILIYVLALVVMLK